MKKTPAVLLFAVSLMGLGLFFSAVSIRHGFAAADQPLVTPVTLVVPQGKLVSSPRVSSAHFGEYVALEGDWMLVGAPSENASYGAAYLFERNQDGTTWTQVRRFSIPNQEGYAYFGAAVAISGSRIVIGAYGEKVGTETQQGAVYIYDKDQGGLGQWGLVQKLTASDGNRFDYFGKSLAWSGDFLFVGAPGRSAGRVYVFKLQAEASRAWSEWVQLFPADGFDKPYMFGESLVADGDLLLVGTPRADVGGYLFQEGAVYVHDRNQGGVDQWGSTGRVYAAEGDKNAYFGSSIAYSDNLLLVGSPFYTFPQPEGEEYPIYSSGKAYLFERSPAAREEWQEIAEFSRPEPQSFAYFGHAVALVGGLPVVGAHGDTTGSNDSQGAVYVYSQNSGEDWSLLNRLVDTSGNTNQYFGYTLASQPGMLAVGAWGDTSASGAVFWFGVKEVLLTEFVFLPLVTR